MAENQVWRLCSEEPQGDFIVLWNISDPAHWCPGTQIFLQLFLLPWRAFYAYFPIPGRDASDRYDLGQVPWTSCRGGLKRAHLCLASTLGFPRHKGVSIDFISVPAGFSHPGLVCLPGHSFGHGQDQTLGSVTSAPSLLVFSKDWEFWHWQFQYALDNSICDPGEQRYLKRVILKTTHLGFYFELSSLIRLLMKWYSQQQLLLLSPCRDKSRSVIRAFMHYF